VLQILAHPDLLHELVLVTVHSRKLSDVCKHVLQSIGELEGIDVTETELNMGVDNELGETQDFSTQMESVSEARLLPLLGGKSLDRLQVHVVIEMEVVEVLSVDEKVEHVVSLATDLKTSLNPVERGRLEELGVLQTAEQVPFSHGFGPTVVQGIEHVVFELRLALS
jgi:hypothetical protein